MDLDSVADELYSLAPRDFIAVRNDLAARAAEAGDETLARRIRRLRKPSTSAWLANLLSRDRPGEMRSLTELGTALRHAQDALEGEALRALSARRRDLVRALVTQAVAMGRDAGITVSDAVSRELEDTFTAALTDPESARALSRGRLSTVLRPGAGLGGGEPGGGEPGAGVATVVDIRSRRREPAADRRAHQRQRALQELERARAAERSAVAGMSEADNAVAVLARRVERLTERVTGLRAELVETERELARVEREHQAARRDREGADRAARRARRRREDAENGLAGLDRT